MDKYNNDELDSKIHTFLDKKSEKYPELDPASEKVVTQIPVKDENEVSVFSFLESLNSFWARRVHS